LQSPAFQSLLTQNSSGSTALGIQRKKLEKLHIPKPPLKEQRRIASALRDADDLIVTLEHLIAKKQAITQGMMQQLLTGQTRLPGFVNPWEELTLGDVCDAITDGTHYTPSYVDRGIPFYSVENVTRDDFTDVKYISPAEHRVLVQRCRPQRDDILMTRIGSLGNTKYIDWDIDASIYVSLALLRPGRRIDGRYLYASTKSRQFVKNVEDHALLWAAPKKINMGDIRAVSILVPSDLEEQRAIAEVAFDPEAQSKTLARRLDKARAIKTGMMQQLLTGRTRLPVEAAS
jgi:type I restriction enzyme S subunit